MHPPRRAQKKKKQAHRGPLPSIAEESAPTSREASNAATDEESLQLPSREERLAHQLARQKDFNVHPGSSAAVREFQRTLSSTKAGLAQFEADLVKLRRLSGSGRTAQAVQATPPAPPNPTPATATPFPHIPIPFRIPPPSIIQQIERVVSGGWIPYYGGQTSGVSLQYIDGAGRPVAQVIPHLYFPWAAPPQPPELGTGDEIGDGHYYYPYFSLPARGG